MEEKTKKMWMNIFSTALGVAIGFGVYNFASKQWLNKGSQA